MIGGGLLLLAAALLLAGGNFLEADRAALASEQVLQQMEPPAPVEADPPEEPEEVVPAYVLNPDMEMPETEVDGHRYIGVLEIPALELELPIMSQWSYPNLKIAPCRYQGSAYQNDLILLAHNYSRHFGQIHTLEPGTPYALPTRMEPGSCMRSLWWNNWSGPPLKRWRAATGI